MSQNTGKTKSATHELIKRVNRIEKTVEELNNKFTLLDNKITLLVDYLRIDINYLVEMKEKEQENKRNDKKYEETDFEGDHRQEKSGDEGGNDKKYEETDSEEDHRQGKPVDEGGNDKSYEETDSEEDHRQGKPGDKGISGTSSGTGNVKKYEKTKDKDDETDSEEDHHDSDKRKEKGKGGDDKGKGKDKDSEEDDSEKGKDKGKHGVKGKGKDKDSEEDQRDKETDSEEKGKHGTIKAFFFRARGPFAKSDWFPHDIKITNLNILVTGQDKGFKGKSFALNTIMKTTNTSEEDGGVVFTVERTNGKFIKFKIYDKDKVNDFNDILQDAIQNNKGKRTNHLMVN